MTIHKALIPNKLKAVSFVSFLSFQAVFFNKTIKNGQYTTNSLMYFTVKAKKCCIRHLSTFRITGHFTSHLFPLSGLEMIVVNSGLFKTYQTIQMLFVSKQI